MRCVSGSAVACRFIAHVYTVVFKNIFEAFLIWVNIGLSKSYVSGCGRLAGLSCIWSLSPGRAQLMFLPVPVMSAGPEVFG